MSLREINFKSYNERDIVKGWVYTPIIQPRAVIQLVHGLGEHSRRYLHMITTLQEAGFVIYTDDHVGHGATAAANNTWGNPGDKGFMTFIEDEQTLREMANSEYPDLPYFMFGHSLGSMIARGVAAKYGEGIKGLILCGVVAQMKGFEKMCKSDATKKLIEEGHGDESGIQPLLELFEGSNDRFEEGCHPNAWVCNDPDVVLDHASDPFNLRGEPSLYLINDLVECYKFIFSNEFVNMIPTSLPIYLIAGDNDPCTNYGEGLYHVANMLSDSGHKDVTVKCYCGYRHEIHNCREIRGEVEEGLLEFLNRFVG